MIQDSLRSAVYRSLTKPLADGCQNEKNQTVAVACRTHSNSNSVQGKGHQVLEEKKAMEQRDKGELTRSTDFSTNSSKDLDESMAMLSKLKQAASKRMSHSKPRQKREEILLEEDCIEDIMSSRRFLNQEPRFSVDGSSRNYTEKQLRRRMSHLKYIDEDFGVSERMSLRRFGFQAQRHSVDGSTEQMQRMSQLFQLKQRSEFLEQDIGDEDRMKPGFSVDGCLLAERFKLQEPRFSVGRSCSIDGIEELRRVIKNSLCQKNLLSRSPKDERACIEKSLSPLKGSIFERSKNVGDDDAEWRLPSSSVSATPQAKTEKGPNLIVKLLGLEKAPLQSIDPIKKEEKKRGSNVPRLNSATERLTARKQQLVEKKKKAGPKQKSLQEIIEALQFKGQLKSGQFNEPSIKRLETYGRNCSSDDESPPIVIMKPLNLPQWERGEVEKYHLLDNSLVNDEILNADLIRENRVSDRKEVKRIEKVKVDFSTASHKQQGKEAFKTRKRAQERQKPIVDVTTIEEKKRPVKSERMPISQSKSDKRRSTSNNKVSQVKPEAKKNSANSLKEKKTPRRKSDSKSIDIQKDDKSCKNSKETNPAHKMDTFSGPTLPADKIILEMETDPKTYEKDVVKEDQEPNCEVMPKSGQAKKIPELSKEVIHLPVTKPAAREEVVVEDDLMRLLLSSQSFLMPAQELYAIDAPQLYAIDAPQLVHHQTKGMGDDVIRNAKLYLDCGMELMARKSHKHELMMYPVSRIQMWDLTASFTLHQLAEEISSRVRTLTSYIKVDRSITSNDVLYLRLERDLRCNDVMGNAVWDIGWLSWGYPEEAVQLACEVEESILSLLVAEVATEFGQVWKLIVL